MSLPNLGFATESRPKAWSGAIGNVVISDHPVTLTAITYNGGAAGGVIQVYDNATTNAGNILWAATLVAAQIDTFIFPVPITARNGITIDASAALGVGSVHAY